MIKRERTQTDARVVYLNQPFVFKPSLSFVAVYRHVFVGVSHDFIINRATRSLVFLSGNKRHRYFHESFDTWIMESIML